MSILGSLYPDYTENTCHLCHGEYPYQSPMTFGMNVSTRSQPQSIPNRHNQYQTYTIHVHHPNPNEIVYEEEFEESDHIIACSVVDKAVNHSIASRSLVKFLQNKDLLRHYHRINWWLLLCIVHHWYNDYIRVSHGIEEAGCINKYCTIGIRRPFM
eukprot:767849_1